LLDGDLDDREELWAVVKKAVEGEEVGKKKAMVWMSE
jgi:hypothetical protein